MLWHCDLQLCSVLAFADIHVSALLQFGVGVGSFYGIPTFRCDASLWRRIFPLVGEFSRHVGTPTVWSPMAMAIRVATLLFFGDRRGLCIVSRMLLLHPRSDPSVRTDASLFFAWASA